MLAIDKNLCWLEDALEYAHWDALRGALKFQNS